MTAQRRIPVLPAWGILLAALVAGCSARNEVAPEPAVQPVPVPAAAPVETPPAVAPPPSPVESGAVAAESPPAPAPIESASAPIEPAPAVPVKSDVAAAEPPPPQTPIKPQKAVSPTRATPAQAEPSPVPSSPEPPVAAEPATVVAAPKPGQPEAPPPAARPVESPLDLPALKERLKETKAIGVMTKLTLKNQVDDLLERFQAHYRVRPPPDLAPLRQAYNMLVLKVLTLIQDGDPALARTLASSREAIWAMLADPVRFQTLL